MKVSEWLALNTCLPFQAATVVKRLHVQEKEDMEEPILESPPVALLSSLLRTVRVTS